MKRESSSDSGGDRGRYKELERGTITAVRSNLISVIDRIKETKRPQQLDIHSQTEGGEERKGAQRKAQENLLNKRLCNITTPEQIG